MPSSAEAGSSPPSTAQMALALTQIVYNREYNPPSHPRPEDNSPQLKHLQLLDLLALLLVTDSQGDVAATMLVARSKGTYDFYYAKNRPCFDSEKVYINALLATLSNENIDFKEKTIQLMALVVKNCSKKIMHRVKKIVRRVKEIHPDFFNSPGVPDSASVLCSEQAAKELGVEKFLREVMPSVFWEDQSLGDFLSGWIQYLHSTSIQEMLGDDPGMVLSKFGTPYLISETKEISQVIDQTLLNHIKKLGDYYRAVVILTESHRAARIGFTDETRPFLTCTEVCRMFPYSTVITRSTNVGRSPKSNQIKSHQ
jgi:hypothetical protein